MWGMMCSQARYYKGKPRPGFAVDETVWITRHKGNKKYQWQEGVIIKKIGTVLYAVYVPSMNCEVTRHIDQIRRRKTTTTEGNSYHSNWSPDVIPDIEPADSDAAVSRDATPCPSPSLAGESQLEEEGEPERETSCCPESPPPAAVNPRRRELTPIVNSPPAADTSSPSPEPGLDPSVGTSRSFFNFSDLFS
ncbi:zinc finger homeobox protein 4-like [Pectinophora gossypiella]|uniref:zinc finger homeobox protein 4-like n=1 Tax=Pectinophora gossypiella TaxID=13191 RepID=UPI00214EF384|nr:zinc finger homeobox protein 4-like [Pectinophora gossypiella]